MSEDSRPKTVFVTVGTTSFDELVKAATEESFQKLLVSCDYTKLTVQVGRGEYIPGASADVSNLNLSWYRYKKSLATDMKEADLIISHGGAGSIMEALSLQKPLIVVVNDMLMDNHQTELARQLAKDGHLLYATHRDLYTTFEQLVTQELVKFEPGHPEHFGRALDTIMGFSSTQ